MSQAQTPRAQELEVHALLQAAENPKIRHHQPGRILQDLQADPDLQRGIRRRIRSPARIYNLMPAEQNVLLGLVGPFDGQGLKSADVNLQGNGILRVLDAARQ